MTYLIACSLMIALAWVTVRSMSRERAARRRAAAIEARVRQAHGVADVFVSAEDGGFVGLSPDGAQVVLGQDDEDRVIPTADIVAIEGMRDGVMLVRAGPDGDPITAPPTSGQTATGLPRRIVSLDLRLTTADEVFQVRFFFGGKHGVDPGNEAFRKQAALIEAWFRKLSAALRPSA